MTPFQNDPQQHQREAKHRNFRVPRGGKRSPDSDSALRELSKSGLASDCGPQKCDFARNSGGGTTAGAPTWTRVRPRRNQCTTQALSRTPISLTLLWESRSHAYESGVSWAFLILDVSMFAFAARAGAELGIRFAENNVAEVRSRSAGRLAGTLARQGR